MSEGIDRWDAIFNTRNEINKSIIGSVNNADVNIVEEVLLHKLLEVTPLPSGVTGLHAACLLNNFELVKLFIKHGRDVNAQTEYREPPLLLLLYGPEVDVDIVHYLINHGADLSVTGRYLPPIYVAIRKRHVPAVRAILQHTHDINKNHCYLETALLYATLYRSLEIVDLLLANGADPRMAICISVCPGNGEIFQHLLENSENLDIPKMGLICMFLIQKIIDSLSIDCMKVLLQSTYGKELVLSKIGYNNFNSKYRTMCGVTYLICKIQAYFGEAQKDQCEEMFDIMIENGFSVNPVSEDCIPPLSKACSQRMPISYIEKLIQHGANVNHPDSLAPEVLLSALEGSTPDVLHLLFQFSDFATPDSVSNVYVQRDFNAICSENISFFIALGMTPSTVSLLNRHNLISDKPTVNICSLKQLSRIAVRHMFHSKWKNLSIDEILKKLHLPVSVCQYLKYEIV